MMAALIGWKQADSFAWDGEGTVHAHFPKTIWTRWNPETSAPLLGIEPGPHNGVGPGFPGLDSRIAISPIATIRLVSPWRHPLQLFVVFHTSTVWFASPAWWNWLCLHLHLPCSEQHWCGQLAHASSHNHVSQHSTDLPEPWHIFFALREDTPESKPEATPEDTLDIEDTF